jgi:2-polyprenyl-6-methoxyphenol hydroxylase-like FAD-dependent oxidoreductase
VPVDDFRVYVRPQRAVVMLPTHDDLRLVLVGWPREQFATHRQDLDGAYRRGVEAVPQVAELLGDARRQTRITGTGDLLNCFRHPYGLGWALVGDAGYVRDPCTAQGISDSFRDAELLADALDAYLRGDEVYDTALAGYHRRRDAAVRAMYDFTYRLAQMKPLPAPVRGIFRTLQYDQRAMDLFVSGVAGTAPVNAATGPRSLGRALLARARARGYGRTAPTGPDGPDGPDDAARGGPVGGDLPSLRDLA